MAFPRQEVLARLKKAINEGRPIMGAGAGTGISAKFEEVGVNSSLGDCLKCQWGYEAGRCLGHHHVDHGAGLCQAAGQKSSLIRGHTAGNAQKNSPIL